MDTFIRSSAGPRPNPYVDTRLTLGRTEFCRLPKEILMSGLDLGGL